MQAINDIDWDALTSSESIKNNYPSPAAWEDQVLYFLMLDRFSNGQENGGYGDLDGNEVKTGTTPLFTMADAGNVSRADWEKHSQGYRGGTLKGLQSKIGYLKRLGVTAIWISPVLKQVRFQATYHGYGIQDFLAVEPNFGTAQDLKELVAAAHKAKIYVILDVILNHTGNVFAYRQDRYWTTRDGHTFLEARWDGRPYAVAGFNDASGAASLPFGEGGGLDDAVWPRELQSPASFTQKGEIKNWDYDPEYREGDFSDLKDVNQGSGPTDTYQTSAAFRALVECYQYWIAYANLDGFRIDTVKHMDPGATRYFAACIHEFAMSIGKENFYLVGEITGGRSKAFTLLEETGLNAALGIDEIPDKLEYLIKGYRNPKDYFDLFRNSVLVGKDSHTWFRNKVVTMFDDHDQVRKGKSKARFCAGEDGWKVVINALALNLTTVGIPCIYYGTEQSFNGHGVEEKDGNDVFLRECMFGGTFGSLQSAGRHFFNEGERVYQEVAKIIALRNKSLPLRRGRQYLREISGNGTQFGLPEMVGGQIRSVVPWTRIFNNVEVLLAINTDYDEAREAWVTLDNSLHAAGDVLTCVYSTDATEIGNSITIEARNGKAVRLRVPAAGFVIYQ